MGEKINKKAQVSIFIVIAVLVVGIIAIYFLIRSGIITEFSAGGKPEENPESYLKECIQEKVQYTIKTIMIQGGYMNRDLNIKFQFEGEEYQNISYLCYTSLDYISCTNQEAMLFTHIKQEIKNEIEDEMEECVNSYFESLKNRGFEVSGVYNGFSVDSIPEKVILSLDAKVTLTKGGETTNQKDLKIVIPTRIYELTEVVQEITSQEARFCYFENGGYMMLYPEFKIERYKTSRDVKIYTVIDKRSEEVFRFAVRSCRIPPGQGTTQ
jgi:hypothetical protein